MRSLLTVALFVATSGTGALGAGETSENPASGIARGETAVLRSYHAHGWLVRETANFRIMTWSSSSHAQRLPQVCESLRCELQRAWCEKRNDVWSPRCDIVLHPSVESYRRSLGPGSEQSAGCTSLRLDKGKVVVRRVDLREDAEDWLAEALPHELTHVVIADRFCWKQLPRWADEGMAILAESHRRQLRRHREFERAATRQAIYHTAELLRLTDYPTPAYRDAFYGQSASLVEYLVARDGAETFLRFVERGMTVGYDAAARDCYGISLGELDSQWRPRLHYRDPSPPLLAQQISHITAGAANAP